MLCIVTLYDSSVSCEIGDDVMPCAVGEIGAIHVSPCGKSLSPCLTYDAFRQHYSTVAQKKRNIS